MWSTALVKVRLLPLNISIYVPSLKMGNHWIEDNPLRAALHQNVYPTPYFLIILKIPRYKHLPGLPCNSQSHPLWYTRQNTSNIQLGPIRHQSASCRLPVADLAWRFLRRFAASRQTSLRLLSPSANSEAHIEVLEQTQKPRKDTHRPFICLVTPERRR